MTAVDYILEGLAKALEVERECGVRSIEIDRELLVGVDAGKAVAKPTPPPPLQTSNPPSLQTYNPPSLQTSNPPTLQTSQTSQTFSFVFLNDRALSPKAVEMMAKIIEAMKATAESAPIVFTGERPVATVYVVLGSAALRKWFPTLRGSNGQWLRGEKGEEVLVVESPETFVRFGTLTPAFKAVKRRMWDSLKMVMVKTA